MRLVSTRENPLGPFTIDQFKDEDIPQYAILSHTWDGEEVTFQDMQNVNVVNKKSYRKIHDCCSVARAQGLDYVWMDTCCIDKTSSTELSEAINSMYRWYQEAFVCYAYLADAETPTEVSASRWFERGFTLQELIAPSAVIFYSQTWSELGTKETLQNVISKRTNIPIDILTDADRVDDASVAQRMSWAANRKTSRLEDEAYCLMGLFGINMPLLYGEGKAAFIRLQEEIIKMSDDHSIFAWKAKNPGHGGLLAPSVDAFSDSGDIILTQDPLIMSKTAWTTTNQGLHLELCFIGIGHGGLGLGILPCTRRGDKNRFFAIYLQDQSLTMERFERVRYHKLELLDLTFFVPFQFPSRQICTQQRRLAVTSRRIDRSATQVPLKHSNGHSISSENRSDYGLEWFDQWLRTVADEWNIQPSTPTKALDTHLQELNLGCYNATTEIIEVTQSLLSRRETNVNLQDQNGRTLLSHVAGKGYTDIVSLLLLARHKVKVNLKDKAGRTPLSYAIEGGHGHVVWLLLSRGDILVDYRDNFDFTPVLYAAKQGSPEIINMLLAHGVSPDSMKDGTRRTVICHASEAGHVAAVRVFLTRTNIRLDIRDKFNKTPLIYAAANGHNTVVSLLLAYGAEVQTSGNISFDRSPTWLAALAGHEDVVRLLLPHVIGNVHWLDKEKRTMLHWSAIKGYVSIVRLLLDHGADTETIDNMGNTPVSLAALGGHEGCVRMLLPSVVKNLEWCDEGRRTMLHWSVMKEHAPIVKLLLDHGANVNCMDKLGNTPVWLAASNDNETIMELLLSHGAVTDWIDSHGRNVLHMAVTKGHGSLIQRLLSHGVNEKLAKYPDVTSLWLAISKGDETTTQMLLSYGANINGKDVNQSTLLHRAAAEGNENTMRLLILNGADLEATDGDNMTPIWHACLKARGKNLPFLMAQGANIEHRDKKGRTVLHLAVIEGREQTVTRLLSYGANLEGRDSDNLTPLWHAFLGQHEVIACMLISRGANIRECDDQGRTPLHWAVINKSRLVVSKLLASKAGLEIEDDQGRRPLHWAAMTGNLTITMSLLDAGANVKAEDAYRKMPIRYAKELGDKAAIAMLLRYA